MSIAGVVAGPIAPAGATPPSATQVLTGLGSPSATAFDAAGNLYVTNASSGSVTVVPKTTGTIFGQNVTANVPVTLQAAWGLGALSDLAFDTAGNLYVINSGAGAVTVIPIATGTVFGQAVTANTAATLTAVSIAQGPNSLAFDAFGNLLVSYGASNNVRVLAKTTSSVFGQAVAANTAVVLTAATGLSTPDGLTFDTAGNLYVSNGASNSVSVIPNATSTIFGQSFTLNTAAVLAAATGLSTPQGLSFDTAGDLFVVNSNNNTMSVVPKTTSTIFGQSFTLNTAAVLTAASGLDGAQAFAFDSSGNLYIANENVGAVLVIALTTTTLFGQLFTASTAATYWAASEVNGPTSIAFDAAGNMFVANDTTNTVTVLPMTSTTLFGQSVTANVAVTLNAATSLFGPNSLSFDTAGDLFILNGGNNTVTVIPKTTSTIFAQSFTANVAAPLFALGGGTSLSSLAFDPAGNLYLTDGAANLVEVIAKANGTLFGQFFTGHSTGTVTAVTGLNDPSAIAFDAAGNMFVGNQVGNTVRVVPSASGTLFGQSVTVNTAATLSAAAGLQGPAGIAFDAAGDLFISNRNSMSESVVAKSSGTLAGQSVTANTTTTLSAFSELYSPSGLAFDGAGDLYAADVLGVQEVASAAPPTSSPPSSLSAQAITFTSSPPATVVVGTTYLVTATGGGSINPITYSIDASSTAGACTISGVTVTILAVGTCVVDANQTGNASYSAAPQAQQRLSVTASTTSVTQSTTFKRSSSVIGATVTFTDTFTSPGGIAKVGSGVVRFRVGSTTLCSATVVSGAASCTSRALPSPGVLSVTTSYSGSTGVPASTFATKVTVVRGQVRIRATVTSIGGGSARYVANVVPTSPSFESPGGTVVFMSASGPICSRALVGRVASCTGRSVSGAVHVSYHPGKDYTAPKVLTVVTRR